jgi:uncharacterized protein
MIDRHEHDDEIRSGSGKGKTFEEVAGEFLSRRDLLKTAAGLVLLASPLARAFQTQASTLSFEPIPSSVGADLSVAKGYRATPFLKWGDPILAGAPPFDPQRLNVEDQASQFGYNCDYVGFLPLPLGSNSSNHGLLVVNHEYTNPELMFEDFEEGKVTRAQLDYQLAAHGMSVVEVRRSADGDWQHAIGGRYNRRITATTEFEVTGPAAGHPLMRTNADPTGTRVSGTIGNCAGGTTPWGTVLSGEENFQDHFGHADAVADPRLRKIHERYGVGDKESFLHWETVEGRFDCAIEPNEPNRFGWVVEIDPYDPDFVPKKRTALGRCRHEAATSTVTREGKLVLYSGDDARFEYVYKFVASKPYNPDNREANRDLLDDGVLYVARFNGDGTGEWLPLVHGHGPLTAENGFRSQAEVLIDTRTAADLLGATKMDRPEDIETNPVNGKVYMVLTNNRDRGAEGKGETDGANPRPANRHGHILEVEEEGGDHAATRFKWDIFMLCGDPKDESTYFAGYPKDRVSTVSCPDNIAFDRDGNLWIATDGMGSALKLNDGVFAVPVSGSERGRVMQFFAAVPGAEVCGPAFTPDNTTLFVAIQHPGEGSTLKDPLTRWPDGGTNPPRPTVVAIQSTSGQRVGQ